MEVAGGMGVAPTLPEVTRRPAEKVPSVGPGCKLMHPEDDLSLVGFSSTIIIIMTKVYVIYTILDTLGTAKNVLISEVSTFQG